MTLKNPVFSMHPEEVGGILGPRNHIIAIGTYYLLGYIGMD